MLTRNRPQIEFTFNVFPFPSFRQKRDYVCVTCFRVFTVIVNPLTAE